MQCSIAFSQSPKGSFLVLLEAPSALPESELLVTVTTFADENEFIVNVMFGLSSNDTILSVISNILLMVSQRHPQGRWMHIEAAASEIRAIGLTF
jgi:hypothetical protein